jgi:hypothetical protein
MSGPVVNVRQLLTHLSEGRYDCLLTNDDVRDQIFNALRDLDDTIVEADTVHDTNAALRRVMQLYDHWAANLPQDGGLTPAQARAVGQLKNILRAQNEYWMRIINQA